MDFLTKIAKAEMEKGKSLFQRTAQALFSDTLSYEKEYKYKPKDVPKFVPEQYREQIANLASEHDIDPVKFSALINTENTPWDEKLKNPKKNSSAQGLGQHTDDFVKDYGKMFEKTYNRPYDRTKGSDAISATFLALKSLKERTGGLDEAIKSYHIGPTGFLSSDKKYDQSKKDAEDYFNKVMSYTKPSE